MRLQLPPAPRGAIGPPQLPSAEPNGAVDRDRLGGHVVLVAEDNAVNRDVLRRQPHSWAAPVRWSTTGRRRSIASSAATSHSCSPTATCRCSTASGSPRDPRGRGVRRGTAPTRSSRSPRTRWRVRASGASWRGWMPTSPSRSISRGVDDNPQRPAARRARTQPASARPRQPRKRSSVTIRRG